MNKGKGLGEKGDRERRERKRQKEHPDGAIYK